jgi:hypothetical protein
MENYPNYDIKTLVNPKLKIKDPKKESPREMTEKEKSVRARKSGNCVTKAIGK